MSHWQEWIVAVVLLCCIIRIGMRVYASFHPSKNGGGCGCGCPGCTKGKSHKLSDCCEENKKK